MALNEQQILGGKAIIFQNDYEVWQFRCWISEEKAYVRKSLKTKDVHLAQQLAEDMFYGIAVRVRNNGKIFGKPILEAIQPFLTHKKSQIGVGDGTTIVKGGYDLIFIDGGHTSEIIENDTKLALAMLAKGGCIAWHDYGSKVHTEVTKYLDKLSCDRCLFSIGSTSIVFHSENEKLTRGLRRR